jgi:hypothetical protein
MSDDKVTVSEKLPDVGVSEAPITNFYGSPGVFQRGDQYFLYLEDYEYTSEVLVSQDFYDAFVKEFGLKVNKEESDEEDNSSTTDVNTYTHSENKAKLEALRISEVQPSCVRCNGDPRKCTCEEF